MENLSRFRTAMMSQHIDAYLVPTVDPHFSEYTAEHWKSRRWLSGFTGSAGTLIVGNTTAALWTDSRYFVQAQMQLQGTDIQLQKQGEEGTPSPEAWLQQHYPKGGVIGLDGRLISHRDFEQLQEELSAFTFVIDVDLVDQVWKDRPILSVAPVWQMTKEQAGMGVMEKWQAVSEAYGGKPYLLTALDEIAWLFNIRGNDIAYNPVCTAFALVEDQQAVLFVDTRKISPVIKASLESEKVLILPYESLFEYCQFYKNQTLIYNASKTNQLTYATLQAMGINLVAEAVGASPVSLMKACKTSAEVEGFRLAMLEDGLAWTKLLFWLDNQLVKGVSVTEMQVAEAFALFRKKECASYLDESFEPIVAYAEHGAIVHYEPTPETDCRIERDAFLLMDTGAHYSFGTTDTTRTWHFGSPTDEEKRNYTLVLQGMIRLSMARFPKGTRGAQLDMLARQPLMSHGMSFAHGTGHGVGHVLCVHEGPQSIRLQENPVLLQPGMIQSNEPAVYITGKYGIRIENLIHVQKSELTAWGEFYAFETLTLVPICTSAVDFSLLSVQEKEFLQKYQDQVFNKLSPRLSQEEAKWLSIHTLIA